MTMFRHSNWLPRVGSAWALRVSGIWVLRLREEPIPLQDSGFKVSGFRV